MVSSFLIHFFMVKAGILGGGQLGRMLLQAAVNYPVETYVMESDPQCPAAHLCHHFVQGNIKDYDDVLAFGTGLDVLTIEIEAVNVDALQALEKKGVKVFPNSTTIRIIKNKIFQKEFYHNHNIHSPEFVTTQNRKQLFEYLTFFPAVHKIANGGYDGRGVQLLVTAKDIEHGFDEPSVLEKMINIKQEIAIMVAMNEAGDIAVYPPVEMIFNPLLNQLDFQVCPALVNENILWKAEAMARNVVKELNSPGLFAIELLLDKYNEVWVNETAPRVHNSGHHTIEANYCSQFDMLWRIMLGYPLGNTDLIQSSALVNIVGADKHAGNAHYDGLAEVLKMDNAFVHLYGKKETRPGRKMGHVTILNKERNELIRQSTKIKEVMRVVSREE